MAREATISEQDVVSAAERIRARGEKPTARAVRQLLGAGSMATVLRHLQSWQAKQQPESQKPLIFPAGLQKVLSAFVAEEVAAGRRAAEDELALTQQSLGDLMRENERQSVALEEQQEYIEALQAEKAQLEGRLSQMALELREARQQVAQVTDAAESVRVRLTRCEQQLEDLRPLQAELASARGALDDERALRFDAQKAAAVAAATLEQANGRLTDLQERLARSEAELTHLEAVRNALDAERNLRFEAQKEAAVSVARAGQGDAQLADLQERLTRSEAELALLKQARPRT